jgi:HSP20 family protein
MAQFTFIPAADSSDIADDVRVLFEELAGTLRQEERAYSGECRPTLDVLETDEAVEILVDVAGVPSTALRVLYRAGVVIVAGEKAPPRADQSQAFHLIEREFGRFARAVRVTGAYDIAKARASLRNGELTIVLPKLTDRRGQAHRIRIE